MIAAERKCANEKCGGPLRPEQRADALFCSHRCQMAQRRCEQRGELARDELLADEVIRGHVIRDSKGRYRLSPEFANSPTGAALRALSRSDDREQVAA